jgi:hypothetical protein
MSNEFESFDTEGKTSIQDFNVKGYEKFLRNQIAWMLDKEAVDVVKGNEYNFNDTAVRAKALFFASELVKDMK